MQRLWVLLVCLFAALPAWAGNVSLSLGVSEIQVGQTTRVIVTVTGEQPARQPQFAETEGLRVRYREVASEFRSSPGTGIVQTYRYVYEVTPSGEGRYTVGPAEVVFRDGTTQKTSGLPLKVVPRTEVAADTDEIVAESKFRRESVWEGEVVLYDATLTARIPIREVQWRFPEFEGLQVPANVGVHRTQTRIGDPDGDITIVKAVVPLVAAGTGDRTQPPAVATVSELTNRYSPFGLPTSRRRQEPATQAPLQIKPLPKGPDEFSGLVGDFRIQSVLEKTDKVKIGESVGWTVNVIGDGVVDGFELPDLEGLKGVRVYRDEAHTAGGMVEGEYVGRKTFSMVLVPTERGVIELPELSIVVFSPSEGRYVIQKVELGKLTVMGSGAKLEFEDFGEDGGDAVDAADVEPVDLEDIYTWGASVTPPLAPFLPVALVFVLAPGVLVLAADGGGAARSWWRSRASTTREVRGKDRLRNPPPDPEAQLALCDLALREVLADRTGVPVAELRRDAALAKLPPEVAENVQQAFYGLDRARFAGGDVPDDAIARVKLAIQQLEQKAA